MSEGASNHARQRRVFLGISLLIAAAALGVVSFGNIGENLVYYWDSSQLHEAGEEAIGPTIRLGGVVQEGTMDFSEETGELRFLVGDGKNTVKVHSMAAPPQMFREGIGVVVEGTLTKSGVFESRRLMVKHSNEYRAPEEGADVKDLYKTVEAL